MFDLVEGVQEAEGEGFLRTWPVDSFTQLEGEDVEVALAGSRHSGTHSSELRVVARQMQMRPQFRIAPCATYVNDLSRGGVQPDVQPRPSGTYATAPNGDDARLAGGHVFTIFAAASSATARLPQRRPVGTLSPTPYHPPPASKEIGEMRPLRYSINVTLDGCVHHEAGVAPDEELMRFWTAEMERADAVIYGRTTYEMMEGAWRRPASGQWPDWMSEWEVPFAEAIDRVPKYVVSRTLDAVDWNAELIRGDLSETVRQLKQQPGERLSVGGVTLPLALAELSLIDEYIFVVHPLVAGHGPRLLDGLNGPLELVVVDRREFASGAVAVTYRPRR